MSASLVGSEMCIRDSALSGRAPATTREPAPQLAAAKASAARAATHRAVSYTHLTLPTICSV
eukprot:13477305-Alexandrium_andersonii.AAC.1